MQAGTCQAVILALLLAGCAPGPMRSVNGPVVDAPAEYVAYCQRHPEREECSKP